MTLIATNAGVERMTTWDEGGGGGGGGVGGVGSEGDNLTTWKETTGVSGGIVGVNGVEAAKGNSDHQISHFTSAIKPPPIPSNGLIVRSGKGLPREEEVEEEEEEEEGKVKTKTVAAVVAEFIRREEAGALERHGKCNGRAGVTKSGTSEEKGKGKEAVVVLDQNLQSHSHKNGGLAPSCSKEASEEPPHLETAAPKDSSLRRLHDVQGGGGRPVNEDDPAPNRNHRVEESSVVQVASTNVRSSFSSSSPSPSFTSTYSYPCSSSSSPPSSFFPPQLSSTSQYVSNLRGNVRQGEDKEKLETSKASSNQKPADEPPLRTLGESNGDPDQLAETIDHGDCGLITNGSREGGDAKTTCSGMTGDVGESARGKKELIDGAVTSGASAARTVTTTATSKSKILVEQRTWSCRVASEGMVAGSGPKAIRICNEILTSAGSGGPSPPVGNSTAPHLPTTGAPTAKVNPPRSLGENDEAETQCRGTTTGKRESSQKSYRTSEVERTPQNSPRSWAEGEGYATCLEGEQDEGHPKGDSKGHGHKEVTEDRLAKEGQVNVKGSEAIVIGSKDKRDAASPAACQSSCKPDQCPGDYDGEEEEEYCFDNMGVVEAVVRSSGVDNDEDSAVMSVVEKEDKDDVRSQRKESEESLDQQKRAGEDLGEAGPNKSGSEPCVGDKHHEADCDTDKVRDGKEILSSYDLSGKELRVNDQRENGHALKLDLHDPSVGGEVEKDPSSGRENVKEELGFEEATWECDVTEMRDVGDEGTPCSISPTHKPTVQGGLPPSVAHNLPTRLPQPVTPPPSPPPPLPSSPPPFATPPHQSPPSKSPDVPSSPSSVSTTLHLPQQSGREDVEPETVIVFVAETPEPDRPVTTTTTTCCVLTPPSPGSREDVISAAETLECGFKRLRTESADNDTAATRTRTVTLPAPECAAGQGEATAAASRSSASPSPPSSGAAETTHGGEAAEAGAGAQVAKAATSTDVSSSQGAVEAASGLTINILPHSFSSHVRPGLDEIATHSPTEASDVKETEEDNKDQLGLHLSGLNGNDRESVEKSPKLYKVVCGTQQKDHLHQRLPSCRPLSDEGDGGHGDVAVLRLPKEDVELRSHVDEIVIDATHPPPRFDSALATCHEDHKAMASYHDHPLLCQSPEGVPGTSQVVVVAAAAAVTPNGYSSKVQQKLCHSLLGTRPALFEGDKSASRAPEVDSDYEYEAARKEKLQTACKDIAAALSVLLPSAGSGGEETTTKATMTAASTKTAAPSRAQAARRSGSSSGCRVGKEGGVPSLGTADGARRGSKRRRKKSQGSRQCRKCHGRECLAAHKCSAKRGSFYDNCSSDHSECEVAEASKGDTSAARALSCGKGVSRRVATTGECDIRSDIMLSNNNNSGVAAAEKESYARRGGGTKECTSSSSPPPSPSSSLAPTSPSASDSSSEDEDDDEDYCQTEDCGEDCDYCSADGVEDEDDPCDMCHKNRESLARICKHSGVITNGILKCYRKRLQDPAEISRVTGHRPFALQSVVRRRRPGRRGLVAIRESSITSDEHPEETEEEEEEEDDESFDGSNCDLSSSWRFALHRMSGSDSRDSTLRRKQRSFEGHAQEKCNSLPSASSRSLNKDLSRRTGEGLARQVSTSDDELANMCSKNSLPRTNAIPPRPPRNPRTRPPAVPSPSGTAIRTLNAPPSSPNTPRPALGLQGLNRSPATSRSSRLPSPALPLSPRSISPRSPSNPNPPFGFPPSSVGILPSPGSPSLASSRQRLTVEGVSAGGLQLQPPASPNLSCRLSSCSASSSRGVGGGGCGGGGSGTEPETHPSDSPRVCSRSGVLVSRNFSISDDECGWRNSVDRRHVTITRHESVYREVAEMGYHLTPDSPVDPYWLTWKLGVLQKTVEEVGGRLEEAEKTVAAWGAVPQDPNLADQHVHNVKKFREGLADLQRGVDDVNDQAARFSAHNVPLTPANSARLHDLNNRWKTLETTVNDRWRQLAGRSREVTPMTPAQLASSVAPPWERATASNKVPYYINHDRESTHWDHPDMMELLDSMAQYNHIKFSAYRTAMKLRTLQKKLALEYAKLQTATGIFDEHGLRGQNDRLIDVNDMVVVLSALYASIASDHPEVNTTLAMDLCLNWLLNVYDSQRTGQMRVLSFKVGLVCLCTGHLEEKYRYMFRLIADLNRLVDQRKLGLLLHDCVQVPRQLGEVAAFGGSNIEPSVRSCFTKAGKDRETIEAVHFLSWVQQEPQSLVWLAVLHRVAASENVHHQVKCNICKAYPVVGLRYRCLKCLSFDMCQQCFFGGRSNKSHKVTHPMHEYCTATTTGEDMKDFTKALKNKFKSKRSLQKHAKKGYLPVQTVLEGDALESPAPSPQHNVSSQDMHTRLEMYASRLAEVELRTNSNSTPDSEDEHGLIAQYCQSLSSSDAPLPVPRSPLQIMAAVDAEQKEELEAMIRDLEEENKVLQAEYDRLKAQKPVGSPPEDFGPQGRSETDMIAEAKLLREHKGRLEARMSILEEHNRQLEAQLHRLRQLLEEPSGASSPNKSGTLQTKSVTASQLAMDSPAKVNGHSTAQGGSGGPYEGLEQMSEYVRPPPPPLGSMSHVGNLFSRAGDLGKAVGTLVATMTDEGEKDSRSSHHSTEDSE